MFGKRIMKPLITKAVVFLFLISGLVLTSCSKDGAEKPDRVVGEKKMVDVLLDVHLAEAVLTRARGKGENVEEVTDAYYQKIFEKHNITKATFDTSMYYYQRNLEKLDVIYEQVITELNKMERERELKQKENTGEKKELKAKEKDPKKEELDLRMKIKEDIK